jgi:hypothetical protein
MTFLRTAPFLPGSGPTPTLDLGLWTLDSGLRDELHRETAEQRANRFIAEELVRRGWQESEFGTHQAAAQPSQI